MTSMLLPRSRTAAVLLAAAAAALPLAGCGDSSSGGGGGGNAGADPAALLPASAPAYIEAQVRPSGDLATNLKTVAGKILRTDDPGDKIVGWLDDAMKDDHSSYAKDIAPWLGQRAGVAVTSVLSGSGDGDDVDVVAAIASKDDEAAQKFVDSRKEATAREYRGVKYRYKTDEDTAAAVVDGAVLIGTEKGLKSAIDAKSGAKLADGAAFKKAREVVGTDGAAFAYADPARLFDLAAGAASGKLPQGNAQSLQAFKGILTSSGLQSVAASLNVAKDALQIDAAAIGVKAPASRGDGPGAAASVPAGAWLSVGVGDVGGTVQSALKQFGAAAPGGMDPDSLLQSLSTQIGIDVKKDILSWMGDAALFVRGTSLNGIGGALVVTSKDPAASKAAIPKLRKLLTSMNARPGELRDAPSGATGFSVDAGSSLPSTIDVATKDDKFVIAIGKDALKDALSPPSKLGDSAPFKTASDLLGGAKPSLFVDIPQVVKFAESLAGDDKGFQKAKPTLDVFGPAAAGLSSDGDVTRLKVAVSVP